MRGIKVVTLYDRDFRDPASALREIADAIEAGTYGDVSSLAVVLLGDTMEVFGSGPVADAGDVSLLLQAAINRLVKPIESRK